MKFEHDSTDGTQETSPYLTRRTGLKLLGAGVATSTLPSIASADSGKKYIVKQDGKCTAISAVKGNKPISKFYDYAIPRQLYKGSPGSFGWSYASKGTKKFQKDNTSVIFLYDGPKGLNLVVVNGHLHGDNGKSRAGVATYRFAGLPKDGDWAIKDDLYKKKGEVHAETNGDRFIKKDTYSIVDWEWAANRTDGGVFTGLEDGFTITINPSFNENARHYTGDYGNGVDDWEVVSDSNGKVNRHSLDMSKPVVISSRPCKKISVSKPVNVPMSISPNQVNARMHGKLTVTLGPTNKVDLSSLPPELVSFSPGIASPTSAKMKDGKRVFELRIDDLNLHNGEYKLQLTGMTAGGQRITGSATTTIFGNIKSNKSGNAGENSQSQSSTTTGTSPTSSTTSSTTSTTSTTQTPTTTTSKTTQTQSSAGNGGSKNGKSGGGFDLGSFLNELESWFQGLW